MTSVHEQRPLSPHLQIYRPQITSVTSIMHRFTGIALIVGSFLLVAWLWAAAYDEEYFNFWQTHLGAWYGTLALMGWTFALFYHLFNGIRHLFWDMGKGYEIATATRTGYAVMIVSFLASAYVWVNALQEVLQK